MSSGHNFVECVNAVVKDIVENYFTTSDCNKFQNTWCKDNEKKLVTKSDIDDMIKKAIIRQQ